MYQRDYMLNETRKLALLMAKLLGLKTAGDQEEFTRQFNNALQTEYDTEVEALVALNNDDFKIRMQQAGYSAEKLNALSQLLYVFAQPFNNTPDTISLLKKVLIIFEILEQKHHFDSFENIDKRNTIYRFLNAYL